MVCETLHVHIEEVLLLTVKCKWQKTNATFHAKKLVYDWVARRSPAYPCEISQRWEDEVWEPIPDECSREGNQKEFVTRRSPFGPGYMSDEVLCFKKLYQ